MAPRDEIPLGTFEEQVMLAVLRTSGEAFGMAKRLVGSKRTSQGGVSRRLFSVTRAGAQALDESRAMREELWRGVNLRPLLGSSN
jgi:PadR family transcriptional regulator PadR